VSVNPTAVWRSRPSGSNANGGGFDAGIAGAATDYSQQNAAQASGSAGTATGTTTFSDSVAAAFTAAMVGNCIQITVGSGFTPGWYFVTAFTNSTTVTLDRSPGTGTVAVWNLGGGWADFWTNTSSSGPLVPGNQVLILGSGTPTPSSYTYDYVFSALTSVAGDLTNGNILFANDPATPGYKAPPDASGGMPVIQCNAYWNVSTNTLIKGLYWVFSGTSANQGVVYCGANTVTAIGCVFDQFGYDTTCVAGDGASLISCELFSSVTPGSNGSNAAAGLIENVLQCNIHDTVGGGWASWYGFVINTIVAKCRGYGIGLRGGSIMNCTIDGNLGNGIEFYGDLAIYGQVYNNLISNHTQPGTYGMTVDAGTAATNDRIKGFIDYNVYYNNSTDVNAISYGPHDTHGGSNPFVGQATENYTLA
jgi:hypothetical protein